MNIKLIFSLEETDEHLNLRTKEEIKNNKEKKKKYGMFSEGGIWNEG